MRVFGFDRAELHVVLKTMLRSYGYYVMWFYIVCSVILYGV